MKKATLLMVAVASAILGFIQRSRGLVAAANTYDAAVEVHDAGVRRTVDAAIETRHLLVKKGAGDLTVALCGAADVPLGTIDNVLPQGGNATVNLLGKGPTKKMVASAAIPAGSPVVVAAGGKIRVLPTDDGDYFCVGVSLTAATEDNHIVEVNDSAAGITHVPD